MKLDKYTFARLIALIGNTYGVTVHEDIMRDIDDIIDIPAFNQVSVPVNTTAYADASQVDELMKLMFNGTQKIEAIKMYRHLTGEGLKDAKDAVERHWCKNGGLDATKMISKINQQIDDRHQNINTTDFILGSFTHDQLVIMKDFINSFR